MEEVFCLLNLIMVYLNIYAIQSVLLCVSFIAAINEERIGNA